MPRLTPEQKAQAAKMAKGYDDFAKLTREQILVLLCEEWIYWHECEFEEAPMRDAAIIGLGAMSNILARIAFSGKDFDEINQGKSLIDPNLES